MLAEREATDYMERLDVYEARERMRLEDSGAIKPQREGRTKKEKTKVEKTVSTTDPDAGMMRRPGKPEEMHYLSHQSVDAAHGIVVDVAVTPEMCIRDRVRSVRRNKRFSCLADLIRDETL